MAEQRRIVATLHCLVPLGPGSTLSSSDLFVEVDAHIFLTPGVEFTGKINTGHRVTTADNADDGSHAYVLPEYPRVSGVSGEPVAVEVVAPTLGIPGLLPIGTDLRLRAK